MFIAVACLLAAVVCARRVQNALRGVQRMHAIHMLSDPSHLQPPEFAAAMVEGRSLQLKILASTAFIFVVFLLQSAVSAMVALAFALRDCGETCSVNCDPSRYNAYSLITLWYVAPLPQHFYVTS
jgi:hypothetical protein